MRKVPACEVPKRGGVVTVSLPRHAHSQRMILEALQERPGEIVLTGELVRRLYGEMTPQTYWSFQRTLIRLRKRLPGLEIETVTGYKLRRAP